MAEYHFEYRSSMAQLVSRIRDEVTAGTSLVAVLSNLGEESSAEQLRDDDIADLLKHELKSTGAVSDLRPLGVRAWHFVGWKDTAPRRLKAACHGRLFEVQSAASHRCRVRCVDRHRALRFS